MENKKHFVQTVEESEGQDLVLTIKRNGEVTEKADAASTSASQIPKIPSSVFSLISPITLSLSYSI